MGLDSPVPPLNLSRASPSSATCDDGHNGDTTSTSVDDGMQIMGGEPAGRLSDSDAATNVEDGQRDIIDKDEGAEDYLDDFHSDDESSTSLQVSSPRLTQVLAESRKKMTRSMRKRMAKTTGMKGFFSRKYSLAKAVTKTMIGKPHLSATIIQQAWRKHAASRASKSDAETAVETEPIAEAQEENKEAAAAVAAPEDLTSYRIPSPSPRGVEALELELEGDRELEAALEVKTCEALELPPPALHSESDLVSDPAKNSDVRLKPPRAVPVFNLRCVFVWLVIPLLAAVLTVAANPGIINMDMEALVRVPGPLESALMSAKQGVSPSTPVGPASSRDTRKEKKPNANSKSKSTPQAEAADTRGRQRRWNKARA